MTTAFNFPDLDISPVYFESGGDVDEREQQAVSGRNPSLNDYALHEVLGGLSISDYDNGRSLYDFTQGQIFAGFENEVLSKEDQPFPQRSSQLNGKSTDADRCYPTETGYSFNTSSEEVFAAMECCRVTVEMGCCKESAEDVRSRLRRMGAVVSRRLTGTTTHVVYSFGGKPTVLKRIFAQTKRPFLVDPHWVYEATLIRVNGAQLDVVASSSNSLLYGTGIGLSRLPDGSPVWWAMRFVADDEQP
uniref:BRCT domain-containing protein n=1 Tax=Angiostrongylus cantonensis TaxID=6313 RepID=A0A0K0DK98_ANGCA